ncbi:sensor histidine kinase [Pelagimonas sp. KU-00592-HH]|uniref:sensor histidine kinase n=1 Tax=Pelagimonas sp. KU-00592-HH TaxID=3127651 RepID=UPI003108B3BA
MKTWMRHRFMILLVFVIVMVAASATVWRLGYRQALTQLVEQGESDLALAADRLTAQLQRYQELAVLMSSHPVLTDLVEGRGNPRDARMLLLDAADKTTALNIMFADIEGRVLVSAFEGPDESLVKTPYFMRAMHGALGTHHGVSSKDGRRAFYYAAPSFAADGHVQGVLIVSVDVADVEDNWRGDGPAVFFVDEEGLVFITNRSELLLWERRGGDVGLVPPSGAAPPFRAYTQAGHELWRLDWGDYVPKRGLHLVQPLPIIDLIGEAVIDVSPAQRLAGLQAAVVAALILAFGVFLYQAMQRRQVLAEANAILEERVAMRTRALSETNVQLRREITERQEAEKALKKAQEELVQAEKLSALGQMSAGISHELNQPLMAIRQFAENGALFLQRGKEEVASDNLSRISEMAARMARIIKNLRAFARNESEPMGKVDLVQVINTAVELTTPRLKADRVLLEWEPHTHGGAVLAWGGEVRLAQVFVNLINNAADAMMEQEDRRISISIENAERLSVSVRDIGPGIEDPEKMFEPFYSTKAVGSSEGMGLGLSISYGLVESFGGRIRGTNTERGAMFTVELDPWNEEKAA